MNIKRVLIFLPIGIVAITLFVFLGGTVVKFLWNALLPPLFGLPVVTFWQALGLLALSRILFGGWSGGRGGGGRRWSKEEKDRFRQRVHDRWGRRPEAAAPQNAPE